MIVYEVQGVKELYAKLGTLNGKVILRRPMEQSLELLRAELATYPRKPGKGDFPGFVSEKQRRWFFWALNNPLQSGMMFPYQRTFTLGRRWTITIEEEPDGLTGILGNNTLYAPWVQASTKTMWGTGPQARIHRGRWTTDQQALNKHRYTIDAIFEQAIDEALREFGAGG